MSQPHSVSFRCGGAAGGPQGPPFIVLATGEFVWTQSQLRVAGRGMDFEWTLQYRSQPAEGQSHWRYGYQIEARDTGAGIEVRDGRGERTVYVANAGGVYSAKGVAAEGRLARGVFRLRFADGGVWSFRKFDTSAAAGWIERIEDQNRNALQFEYGATGRLEGVVDSLGRRMSVAWDRQGRLASVQDFTGRQVQYRYGAAGRMEAVRFAKSGTVLLGYDAAGLLESASGWERMAPVAVEYRTDSNGKPRVAAVRRGGEAATFLTYEGLAEGMLVTTNDPAGNVRDYLFDAASRCIRLRSYNGRADASQPTSASRNRPGKPLRKGEAEFQETRFAYHAEHGWLVRKELPGGLVVEQEFELDRNAEAPALERGNLRSIRYRSGAGGEEVVRRFEYLAGFGCGCGEEFVTKETDFRGAVTLREFDAKGNLVRKVERDGMEVTLRRNAFGAVVERVYAGTETLASRTDQFRYSAQHGQVLAETLDATGLKLTTTYRYDDLGRPTVIRDAAGHEHTHEWSVWDRLVRRVLPDGTTEETQFDSLNRKAARVVVEAGVKMRESFVHDGAGRLVEVRQEAARGVSVTRRQTRDANGRRSGLLRGEASVSQTDFDTRGLPLRRRLGKEGEGQTELRYGYNEQGALVSVARGAVGEESTVRTSFDGLGRLVGMEFADGGKTLVTSDANGNAVEVVKLAAGGSEPIETVTQTFDRMDRLTGRTVRRNGAVVQKDRWTYDGRGRLVESVVEGVTEIRQYDALDRCIRRNVDGAETRIAYDLNSNVVAEAASRKVGGAPLEMRYQLDVRGRTVRVEGPGGWFWAGRIGHRDRVMEATTPGMKAQMEYDLAGRLLQLRWTDGGSKPVGIGFEWDEASRLVGLTDPNGNQTRFGFDGASQLVSVTAPDGSVTSRSYDSRGNCTSWKDANGTVVRNSYDVMDRLVRRVVTAGAGVAKDTRTEVYRYDSFGRLVEAKNDGHAIEREFAEGKAVERVDGREIASTFDAQGRRTRLQYPSGYALTYAYRGGSMKVQDAEGVAVETEDGRLRYPRIGMKAELTAGTVGLPERMRVTLGNRTILQRAYQWDAAGNLSMMEREDRRGKQRREYRLDGLRRLVRSKLDEAEEVEYELDAVGNRKSVRNGSRLGRYVMEGADRVMNRYTATPEGRCEYDQNGNLIRYGDGDGVRRMKYDYRNRMVEHVAADGTLTRYTYDCLDRRLSKTVTKGRVRTSFVYVYDGMELVEVRNEGKGTTQSLLRVGRGVYGLKDGNEQKWLVSDAAGSVVAEIGADGSTQRLFDYDDFGQVAVVDGDGKELPVDGTLPPVLYAGYLYDAETRLLKTQTRYLDPGMGRFITPDPTGAWFDGQAKGNAYVYAGNQPSTMSDPTGLSTYRTYSCGGPWPGPRQVMVEFQGCSKARRDEIAHAVCWAFRGSGQAQRGMLDRWITDMSGQPQPHRAPKERVKYWYAGPDGVVSNGSASHIASRFDEIFDATKSDDFDIDCETTSTCDSAMAYVNHGGHDVNVCHGFWSTLGDRTKGYILIHELSHAYADTEDYTYYQSYPSNQPGNLYLETVSLRQNADTYGCFVRDVYF